MGIVELFFIAVGLSMDAFAVSICKGLAMTQCTWKKSAVAGIYFGGFQALMPGIGYLLGVQFQEVITSVDHWIAFILLGLIGINMIKEALSDEEADTDASLDVRTMLGLSIATSIDALAVGVTFAFLQVEIVPAVIFIGVITFTLSAAGVKIGNIFGGRYKAGAEIAGGVILLLMGCKILLEHLGLLRLF
ncbi:MAG: manganese efflux pump [Dorea sp.]|jgi:putative Mn2+ efflux pump MntP|nr:manganese efflux pump [Dorea sp.]